MKNTKANIIKLLEAMQKHEVHMSELWKKDGYEKYSIAARGKADVLREVITLITDNKTFGEYWEIFELMIENE